MPRALAASIFCRIVGCSPPGSCGCSTVGASGSCRLATEHLYAWPCVAERSCPASRASSRWLIAALRIIEHEIHARSSLSFGASPVRIGIAQCRAQIQISRTPAPVGALTVGSPMQIEVDAVLAALEIQIHAAAGGARQRAGIGEQAHPRARSAGP